MKRVDCVPGLETITTLIHGAGLVRNVIKGRDVNSAMDLMDEMEEKQIGHDNVTYHTMFLGTMKSSGIEGVCKLYNKMIERNFVPKTRTVVMLIKFFCESRRLDLGLDLWKYLVDKGFCPHSHALEILVTGLCVRGRLQEACDCSRQILVRGRQMSDAVYRMLQRFLLQSNEMAKLEELNSLIKKLQTVLPPTRVSIDTD
ncbi:hypothetical protein Patl1_19080 [Pistacia atlantica]|uniref:Uncharacterized protein n=1 Tax=Pistacia atlantica TaxID=434234 RepID=A0ACC1BYN9_9ROSI|nr:hypothetical protein Patl1_19080 [Pistacia atlantica]